MREQHRNAVLGRDTHELEFNTQLLGDQLGDLDVMAVGLSLVVDEPPGVLILLGRQSPQHRFP